MRSARTLLSVRRLMGTACAIGLAAALSTTASAESSYLSTWRNRYPNSKSDDNVISGTGSSCQLCHSSPGSGSGYNAYGWKMRQLMGSMSLSAAIAACEPFDSDLDPTASTNLVEINADTQPGWRSGPNNTIYFKSGSTQTGIAPPPVQGFVDPPTCTVTTYCTSSQTSIPGCVAAIGSSGSPSVSQPAQFQISSGSVPGGYIGLCYFSDKGKAAIPFGTQGGFVCLQPGVRSQPKSGGGTKGACNGNYVYTLSDLQASGPSLIVAGKTINAAMWFRDPLNPDGSALSNGIEFSLCP